MNKRLWALVLLVLVFVGSTASAQSKNDTDYHALRTLAQLQRQLTTNPKGYTPAQQLVAVKHDLEQVVKQFERAKVDPAIIQIANDYLAFNKKYEEFLTQCNVINEQAMAQAVQGLSLGQRFATASASSLVGAAAGTQIGGPYGAAAGSVIGFLIGFITGEGIDQLLSESNVKDLTAERRAKILKAKDALVATMIADYKRHQDVAQKLARQKNWPAGAAGFDAPSEETSPFYKALYTEKGELNNTVAREQLESLEKWMKRRPADAYAHDEYYRLAGKFEFAKSMRTADDFRLSAATLMRYAKECRAASQLLPDGNQFLEHRLAIMVTAADLANIATTRSVLAEGRGLFGAESEYAATAAKMWEEILKLQDDVDSKGYLRMRLAWVTVQRGDFAKGFAIASKIADLRRAEKCGMFALNYARLLAIKGDDDDAMRWLEFSVRDCGSSMSWMAADEHLGPIVRKFPTRTSALEKSTK